MSRSLRQSNNRLRLHLSRKVGIVRRARLRPGNPTTMDASSRKVLDFPWRVRDQELGEVPTLPGCSPSQDRGFGLLCRVLWSARDFISLGDLEGFGIIWTIGPGPLSRHVISFPATRSPGRRTDAEALSAEALEMGARPPWRILTGLHADGSGQGRGCCPTPCGLHGLWKGRLAGRVLLLCGS
jgi:hypothetical protein